MDVAVIAALIAAIAAIVSPVITALITQRGSYRLKTVELFFSAKASAYKEVVCIASSFPEDPSDQDVTKLQDVISCAILFSSDDTANKLAAFGKTVLDGPTSSDYLDVYSVKWYLALSAMKQELIQYQK